MIELNKCPICKAKEIKASRAAFGEFPTLTDYGFGAIPVSALLKYSECLRCGVEFQNPRMSNESIESFYADGHYRKAINATLQEMDADEFNRADRIAGELVHFYSDKKIPKSCLDIGSGKGHLVRELEELWDIEAVGVEIDLDYTYVVQESNLTEFDLITFIHSLEHMINPFDTLVQSKEILASDGHLVIEVPSKAAKGSPYRLAHTFVFTPPSLVCLCELAGLEIISVELSDNIMVICRR